jgi:hypothetical protein
MADYDTPEGIRQYLADGLIGLHRLRKRRHEAHYTRKESLEWWCVLGMFVADECGNFGIIRSGAPADRAHAELVEVKDVLTRADVLGHHMEWSASTNALPPLDDVCPQCLHGWTMKTVRDHVYIGSRDDGSAYHAYHKECLKHRNGETTRRQFEMAFMGAGFEDPEFRAIPNEYCPCEICAPWFLVETQELGFVKVGWRKSVIKIDWSRSQKAHTLDGMQIFADQTNVTHERSFTHAYGYEKASEYLRRLRMTAI